MSQTARMSVSPTALLRAHHHRISVSEIIGAFVARNQQGGNMSANTRRRRSPPPLKAPSRSFTQPICATVEVESRIADCEIVVLQPTNHLTAGNRLGTAIHRCHDLLKPIGKMSQRRPRRHPSRGEWARHVPGGRGTRIKHLSMLVRAVVFPRQLEDLPRVRGFAQFL